jgi:hypothetical protein
MVNIRTIRSIPGICLKYQTSQVGNPVTLTKPHGTCVQEFGAEESVPLISIFVLILAVDICQNPTIFLAIHRTSIFTFIMLCSKGGGKNVLPPFYLICHRN